MMYVNPFNRLWGERCYDPPYVKIKEQAMRYTKDDEPREKSPEQILNTIIIAEPPPIPMKLEMPILEKQIKESNEKNESKNPARKAKKNHSKCKPTAMEKI